MSWSLLPNEIILMIAAHLDQAGIYGLMCNSSGLYKLLYDYLYEYNAQYCGSSALFWAADTGNLTAAATAFRNGADSQKRSCGETPLGAAVLRGGFAVSKLLLEHGARPDFEWDELSWAAHGGNVETVKLLFGYLDVNDTRITAAMRRALTAAAAHSNDHSVVLWLLEKMDLLLDLKDHNTTEALVACCERGNYAVAELLLARGAKPDDTCWVNFRWHGSALEVASARGHGRLVELLLRHRACLRPNGSVYNGSSSLRQACERGHVGIVKRLLDHGIRDSSPNASLRVACRGGRMKIVKLLLDSGIRPTQSDCSLEEACKHGDVEIVRLLLDNGLRDTLHPDCILRASELGRTGVVQLLLKQNVIWPLDSVLSLAAENGHYDIVKMAIAAGADLCSVSSKHNTEPRTPLMYAALMGHETVVRLLLDSDVDIDDQKGSSAMEYAIRLQYDDIVGMFVERGVEVLNVENTKPTKSERRLMERRRARRGTRRPQQPQK